VHQRNRLAAQPVPGHAAGEQPWPGLDGQL